MPLMALWPLVELVGAIAFLSIWIYYAAATASLGDITTKTATSAGGLDLSYKVYEFDQAVEYRGWFLIFCLFWTLNFITAIGQVKQPLFFSFFLGYFGWTACSLFSVVRHQTNIPVQALVLVLVLVCLFVSHVVVVFVVISPPPEYTDCSVSSLDRSTDQPPGLTLSYPVPAAYAVTTRTTARAKC